MSPRGCITSRPKAESCLFWKYSAHVIVFVAKWVIYLDMRVENSSCILQELMCISLINKYMSSGSSFSPETNHRVFKSAQRQRNEGAELNHHTLRADTKKFVQAQGWLKCALWSFAEYIMVCSIMVCALGISQFRTIYFREAGKC